MAQFEMQTKARNPDRPAIPIVGGIDDVLQVVGYPESGNQSEAVIRFPDILPAIPQGAVADIEIVSAMSQVGGVDAGDPADGQRRPQRVAAPLPAASGD